MCCVCSFLRRYLMYCSCVVAKKKFIFSRVVMLGFTIITPHLHYYGVQRFSILSHGARNKNIWIFLLYKFIPALHTLPRYQTFYVGSCLTHSRFEFDSIFGDRVLPPYDSVQILRILMIFSSRGKVQSSRFAIFFGAKHQKWTVLY